MSGAVSSSIPKSKEWRFLFSQAQDLATSLEQRLNSVHVLLAFFCVPTKAEELLRKRGVTEDVILGTVNELVEEPYHMIDALRERSVQIATNVGSEQLDTLHLLSAITRAKMSMAYQALEQVGIDLTALRNQTSSYLTGRVNRRFESYYDVPTRVRDEHEIVAGEAPEREFTKVDGQKLPRARSVPSSRPPFDTRPEPMEQLPMILDPERFPWLSRLGRNLTQEALEGKLDNLICREKELNEIIDILGKRRANNPCLVGPPGVGKTAIVEGLAISLARQSYPGLSGKILIELNIGDLLAGTQLRGSLAEKIKAIKEEVKSAAGQIIIFIDEIHTLVRAGATGENAQDASNDLKAALGRGEFPCIGATTCDDYKTYIENDLALMRRFHKIHVEEPSLAVTMQIIEGVLHQYEEHHCVHYDPSSIRASVRLSDRFLHDRCLPAKAIDLLDVAGSRAHRNRQSVVTHEDIAKVVSKLASIPEEHLILEDNERLLRLEEILKERVIGHDHLMSIIADVIRRNYAGFNGPRPNGSFLFLGPPGIGKTETAKALADFLFPQGNSMLRIDMSEYHDSSSVTRLIGAPPGYIGYDEGGQLTEAVRARPYQLILLDEIEKAHRDVQMLLLQLLEEGVLTDGKGRRVDFSQCIIVMTSNLGSDICDTRTRSIGFAPSQDSNERLSEAIMEAAREQMPVELWDRIDERLVFSPLSREDVRNIARLLVKQSSERLEKERDIRYVVTDPVIDWLIELGGYHPQLGARPMRSLVQSKLEGSLAHLILQGKVRAGARLRGVLLADGTLSWEFQSQPQIDSSPPATEAFFPSSPPLRRPTPPAGLPAYRGPLIEEDDLFALPFDEDL